MPQKPYIAVMSVSEPRDVVSQAGVPMPPIATARFSIGDVVRSLAATVPPEAAEKGAAWLGSVPAR